MFLSAVAQKLAERFAHKSPYVEKLSRWFGTSFYWNGFLRFLMEAFMEILISVLLNVKASSWTTAVGVVIYTNLFSVFWLAVLIIVPWFTIRYYVRH